MAVEIVARCRACDGVVPVNRMASRAACDHCGHAFDLPEETWGLVFDEAQGGAGKAASERAAVVASGQVTLRCVFRQTPPHCISCREVLPIDDLASNDSKARVDRAFCPGCGTSVALRHPGASARGPVLVVGEEAERKAAVDAAAATQVLPCGACGAPLPIDATRRTVHCTYCNAESAVPDAIWNVVSPERQVRRWFLVFAARASATADAKATWSSVSDIAIDSDGQLYCVGKLDESDTETAVWSVDREMNLRWSKRSLAGLPARSAHIFVASRGRVGVWYPGGQLVAFLDASNGETVSTFPANREAARRIPFPRCVALAADLDSTFVGLFTGESWGGMTPHCYFLRFTEDGHPVDLWPEVAAPGPPEIGDTIHDYRNLPSHPGAIAGYPNLALGWDGTLYLHGGSHGSLGWVRIARNGFVTSESVPLDSAMRIAGDRRGHLYLVGKGQIVVTDNLMRRLWKLTAADGPAGLAGERLVGVTPEGEVTLVGDGSRLRRLDSKGAVLFASEASRAADQASHAPGWG